MKHHPSSLARWHQQPNLVKQLAVFLGSPLGAKFMTVLRHEFRAKPLNTPVVPGVSYLEVHAFRNASREACQSMIDTIELMGEEQQEPKRIVEAGWATEPLRREPEKEIVQPKPVPAKPTRKKS